MLFDPKWNAKPSLEGLAAWLETKDPGETYEWHDHCLMEQYAEAIGCRRDLYTFREDGGNIYLDLTGPDQIALTGPHTFGAALERVRAKLQRRNPT